MTSTQNQRVTDRNDKAAMPTRLSYADLGKQLPILRMTEE